MVYLLLPLTHAKLAHADLMQMHHNTGSSVDRNIIKHCDSLYFTLSPSTRRTDVSLVKTRVNPSIALLFSVRLSSPKPCLRGAHPRR